MAQSKKFSSFFSVLGRDFSTMIMSQEATQLKPQYLDNTFLSSYFTWRKRTHV